MVKDRHSRENWPEKYTLGHLNDDQRLEFEAHMLECESCFQEVQLADRYVAGVRSLADDPMLQDTEVASGNLLSRWPTWALAAAAVILLAGALFIVMRGSGIDGISTDNDTVLLANLYESGDWQYLALVPPSATMRSGPVAEDIPAFHPDHKNRVAFFFDRPDTEAATLAKVEILNRQGEKVSGPIPVMPTEEGSGLFGTVWAVGENPAGRYRLLVLDETGLEAGSAWFVLDK